MRFPPALSKPLLSVVLRILGYRFPSLAGDLYGRVRGGLSGDEGDAALRDLLIHCLECVPHYAGRLQELGGALAIRRDPCGVLRGMPLLDKFDLRSGESGLRSKDLPRRRWSYNTSGGSTGEPVRLVQDRLHFDRSAAVTRLYSRLCGADLGDPLVYLWGSERDILEGTERWDRRVYNVLANVTYLNAFLMAPERMKAYIELLARRRPKLVIAYAQSACELARFSLVRGMPIRPPGAVIVSAGTLYPFMRETIGRAFGCPVYNRYGSREVGDVACEVPEADGLWVAPWGSLVEVVGDDLAPVPDGTEGELVLTCLTNFAMPLLRYRIGDRGTLLPASSGRRPYPGQALAGVSGRTVDLFVREDGGLVDGEYFTHLLYFRDWVRQFRFVQERADLIRLLLVVEGREPTAEERDEIVRKCRMVMGPACRVVFDVVESIPPAPSGKHRYTISNVRREP